MMKLLCITNNEAFYEKYKKELSIEYHEVTLKEIMILIRDKVHLGYQVLTHPLSGSIKPNETPFKTVFIKAPENKAGSIHMDSLRIIENAIITCDKFVPLDQAKYKEAKSDFEIVDLGLAESALIGIQSF